MTNVNPILNKCKCWVSKQPEVEQFGIRFGAHSTACVLYRPSLDPLDRKRDEQMRDAYELHIMDDDAEENAKRGLILRIM